MPSPATSARNQSSRAEAEASEQQFRTLANSIPQLAWMANAEGYIFWYNDRWYEYTGTTLEEMEGWGWQKVRSRNENASKSG
jgi:PAS domain S-box-containing protein